MKNRELEVTLLEKRLEEARHAIGNKYGAREAKIAEYCFRTAMTHLNDHVTHNKVSARLATACFIEFVYALDGALDELVAGQQNSKN
jgi:hypothetical protein